MGTDLEEYLPADSSAVIVVDDLYLDGVDKALTKSTKKINSGDYDQLTKALQDADKNVSKAAGA